MNLASAAKQTHSRLSVEASLHHAQATARQALAQPTQLALVGYVMAAHPDADRAHIPLGSMIFGYGPMSPFVAAAFGAWTLSAPWPALATRLAIIWGACILIFVAGVRRGYGFGDSGASTAMEIATMLTYFISGGVSLVLAAFGQPSAALGLLLIGFMLVSVFDRRAAFDGDAPRHFARLRGPQMAIAVVALALLLAHLLLAGNRA